jgi:CRP-like cAMP-binding protein
MAAIMRADMTEWLRDVDLGMLRELADRGELFEKSYAKGVTVHSQGEICGTLNIVLAGKLAAYALTENGSAVTLFEFTENSVIGANLLFGDYHAYPLTIHTLSDCKLLYMSKNAVTELLHEYGFVMRFVRALSQNSQGMNKKILMLTQRTLRENILEYLRQQSVLQQSLEIRLPISKKELADLMGVQRPSLFRELKHLQEERIIAVKNRSVKILENR